MGYESPQKKPGTQHLPDDRSSDKGSPLKDPLAGNTGTSTHTEFHSESVKSNTVTGKLHEGQNVRGYDFNQKNANVGSVEDATVAPDGTRRVKTSG